MIPPPALTAFERDIADQGEALRRVAAHYAGDGVGILGKLRVLAADAPTVVLAGMGSSLSAVRPAAARIATRSPAMAAEAGELLHYGLDTVPAGALVVLVSQSGRSAETLALGERLRARGDVAMVAVTNDPDGPLAALAETMLPILAGTEATVATKTFMTTFAVLGLIAEAIVSPRGDPDGAAADRPLADALQDVAAAVDVVSARMDVAAHAAQAMAGCDSISFVGRGPSLAAAEYGALILKETVALPAEAMPAGSFRHGPLEICGPRVGLVVLAQAGPTLELSLRLARDSSGLGSPTWLITDAVVDPPPATQLLISTVPPVVGTCAALPMSVPIQRLAAALATRQGRTPGELLRSRKVTDTE